MTKAKVGYVNKIKPINEYRDIHNRFRTLSLFVEFAGRSPNNLDPIWTLKEYDVEKDGKVYPSFRKLYMEYSDPTEYKLAMDIFGSWDHWQKIVTNNMIYPYIEKYREELEIKLRSESLKSVIELAKVPDVKNIQAAKWIASGQWKHGKGRPSKEDKIREARKEARIQNDIEDDLDRVLKQLN